MSKSDRDAGLRLVLSKIKGAALARKLGLSPPAVYQWTRVPDDHILAISDLTGIPPHKIRPDRHRPPRTTDRRARVRSE